MAFQYKRRLTGKLDRLLTTGCSDKTKGNSFKLEEGSFRLDIRKKFFTQGSEALEQAEQRCLIPGDTHGQAGWGFGQPDLGENVLTQATGLWSEQFLRPLSVNHSMIF